MCLPGTESRGIINGGGAHDLLILKHHGAGDRNEEDLTMRARGDEGGATTTTITTTTTTFIRSFLQRLPHLPSDGVLPRELPLTEIGEELRSLVKIAGPIVITSMLIYSRSLVSMLFLGRLGKTELAGGSLALGFSNITGYSLLRGLSTGMDPICSQAYGAQRWSVISQTFQKTLCLLLLVAIPISLLWLNMEPIFILLGQDPQIIRVAKRYMAFAIPELIGQAQLLPLRIFFRTQGFTTALTLAAAFSALFHLPMNYFLVTYMDFGVAGIALGLAWNTFLFNLGLVIYLARSPHALKPWHGLTILSAFQGWGPLLSLSLPSCVSVCLEWWWYELMLFFCGWLSNPQASVAAMGILLQTTGMLYIIPISLSGSLSTRVGLSLGAGQPTRAQWTTLIGLIMAFAWGISAFIFMTAFRSMWGTMFTNDPQILDLISTALPVLGLCEIGNVPQTASCGVLTATARPKLGVKINLLAFYLIGLPVAILATFTFKIGFLGLWFGLLSAQLSCVGMMVYTLLHTDWKHQTRRAEQLTQAVEVKNETEENLEKTNDEESGLLTPTEV
ncbi:hypothetical protein ACFX13_010231 [Malus domestica]|uniref:Protein DETOXIFICATION n=1 Tax=Malus domestica TaxID=3750 RepID=A0A498IIJ4_MALDO|nr:hypothetical protein DVH24_036325 [Malus domestica]